MLAYHEAGHAAAVVQVGDLLIDIYITGSGPYAPNRNPRYIETIPWHIRNSPVFVSHRGNTRFQHRSGIGDCSLLVVKYAGRMAERLLIGHRVSRDDEGAALLEASLSPEDIAYARREAENILKEKWPAVKALAAMLLDLDYVEGAAAKDLVTSAGRG